MLKGFSLLVALYVPACSVVSHSESHSRIYGKADKFDSEKFLIFFWEALNQYEWFAEAALVPFADSNTLSPQKDASDRHLSRAALIGVSVGSAVGASLIAVMLFVLIYCMCRKKTLNRKQKTAAGMYSSVT